MNKYVWSLVTITLLLGACSKETKDMVFVDLYDKRDNEVVVNVNGQKLTIEELKQITFDKYATLEINHFIEQSYLAEKYPVSADDIDEQYDSSTKENHTKKEMKHSWSLEKETDNSVVNENLLREIYEKKYNSTVTKFEDVKEEIKVFEAPYYLHRKNLYEYRKNSKIKYINKDIQNKAEDNYFLYNNEMK